VAESNHCDSPEAVKSAGLFAKLPHEVIDRLMLASGTAAKVYLWLARRADFKSGQCYPSLREIAARTGTSRGTACRAIAELASDPINLIEVERRNSEHGDADVSLYHLKGVAPAQHVLRKHNTGAAPAQHGVLRSAQQELETSKNKRHGNEKAAAAAELRWPESIDTPESRKAWDEWINYRRESKKPLKPQSQQAQLNRIAEWGPQRLIAAVSHSIAQGYQGLFEPGGKTNGSITQSQLQNRFARERGTRSTTGPTTF